MKIRNIFMSILSLFSVCALVVIFVINQNVYFELNGEDNVTIEVNSTYEDDGYVARVFNNDISKMVQVKNKVDYNKIGNYDINYYLIYVGKIYMHTRTINVVDSVKPEIKLIGEDNITIFVGEEFSDDGAIANDNYDGNITNDIIVDSNLNINKSGNYSVTYSVKDSSGNENKIVRNIKVINN